jgi:hypothetical protein
LAVILAQVKINISYANKYVSWFGNTIPLQNARDFTKEDFDDIALNVVLKVKPEKMTLVTIGWNPTSPAILNAKYEKLDINEFIATQTHLDKVQRNELKSLLKKHEKLFDGTLGVYPSVKPKTLLLYVNFLK